MDAGRPSKRVVVEMNDDAAGLEQRGSFVHKEQSTDTNSGSVGTDTTQPRIKPKPNHH